MEHILKLEQVKKYYGGAARKYYESGRRHFHGSKQRRIYCDHGCKRIRQNNASKLYFHDRHRNRRTHYCQSSGYYKNQRKRLCLIPTKESGIYLSGL